MRQRPTEIQGHWLKKRCDLVELDQSICNGVFWFSNFANELLIQVYVSST